MWTAALGAIYFQRGLDFLASRGGRGECAFSPCCLSCAQEAPHLPLSSVSTAPGSFLRPVASGWLTARQRWLWLWAYGSFLCWLVYRIFLKEKGNQRSQPSSCSFELPSAHISPVRPAARKEAQGWALTTSEIILPPTLWACSCSIHVISTPPSAS